MAKILLVEDVEIVRAVLRRFLEAAGHDVTEAQGGLEASRIAGMTPFDVIVTYLWMNDGDGVQFIRRHAAGGGSVGIIAMTGGDPSVTRAQSVAAALGAGARQVLVKPVTKAQLLEAVDLAIPKAA